ncbi:MAG: extracellular solute-binding protein, partial [Oscillospiraceae bacterium]|nr:extracellular solute-binding protein [Oscillospiraceae bacterium]
VFEAETIPFPNLPSGFDHVENITVANDMIYFTALSYGAGAPFLSHAIFSMNFDGTDLQRLPNYSAKIEAHPDATQGFVSISALHIDVAGFIWVVEQGEFSATNFPEDFVWPDNGADISNYIRELNRTNVIRKLNEDGSEMFSTNISNIASRYSWFNVVMVATDNEGNIYIAVDSDADTTIYVLNADGEVLFNIDVPGWSGDIDMVRTPDNLTVLNFWHDGYRALQSINVQNRTWGNRIDLPQNARNAYLGNENYHLIFTDGMRLFGICGETGETLRILSFIDVGISPEGIKNISLLSNEQILLISTSDEFLINSETTELILLSKTESILVPDERIQLTLGTLRLGSELQTAVIMFNNSSTTHYVEVINYSDFAPDWNGAVTRMNVELTAGRVPDIFDLGSIPFEPYASRGLFTDLYSFLDVDNEVNRDTLTQSVLSATERDGNLYRIPIYYYITTILGHPSVLGDYPGWTMAEFMDVIEANPQADIPLGLFFDRHHFWGSIFFNNTEEYVDRVSGTVHFDTYEFIQLLEFAKMLPCNLDTYAITFYDMDEVIATGRQIMESFPIGNFEGTRFVAELFGGEIVFKGWPAEDRNGSRFFVRNSVAIASNSADKDGAWQFVRFLFSDEFQRDFVPFYNFPLNGTVSDERLFIAKTEPLSGLPDDLLSQEAADQILELIDSITGVTGHGIEDTLWWEIISETASDFFNEQITAQEAARIIQSRAERYIAEQSG